MNRLERLINLVAALLAAERPLTADELRQRVPGYADDKAAFRRAFERDKETLRDLGVPVVVEPVSGTDPPVDGYRVPKDAYYLPDPHLDDDELAALHLAASAVRVDLGGGNGVEALWKLGGEVAEAGPAPAVAALPGTALLVPLFGAISARRTVTFGYRGRLRSLDPHRLSFRNGHWYLALRDREAGEDRTYRLDRIETAITAGEPGSAGPATATTASVPSPWELGSEQPVTARLLVDAEQAGWAEGHVGPEAVAERRPDGAVVLEFPVTNRDAFRSFVLGFLEHAELLGPAELREDLVQWLEALCPRLSSESRLHRLLALVPWVATHDGPLVADVCARFGCTEEELVDDLNLLFMCGLHPYTPDTLIDVDIADGRVWIRYADYFSRPLRLTPAEGLALLAAGQAVLSSPVADAAGPLARGLRKLATALGVGESEAVEVALAPAGSEVMATLTDAAAGRRQVEIEYYSFGRDRWSRRTVDPYAVFSSAGQWYVSAYCHTVDDERLFRVDRVRSATALASTFEPPVEPPDFAVYRPRPEDARVVLELDRSARWVVDQYPVEAVSEGDDGRTTVKLAVSEQAWLERLLLRLGPAARVVEGDKSLGHTAACRLLARYRAAPPGA